MQPNYVIQNQSVELRLADDSTYQARVLDTFPDALVLRVPEELADVDAPAEATIAFGHQGSFCRATVPVYAVFSRAWFLGHPDPDATERIQQRQHVRIKADSTLVAIPSNVYGEVLGPPIELRLENLSAGGCMAITRAPMTSDYLMIFLSMLEMAGDVVIGHVIQRRELPGGEVSLGIAFDNFGPGKQDLLAHMIGREIRRHAAAGKEITA